MAKKISGAGFVMAIASLLLAACGPKDEAGGSVEDTGANPPPQPTTNSAPTISGTPSTGIGANSTYTFEPTADDVDGDPLIFSISNKPSWASFSSATGKLTGTPSSSQVRTYSGIVISVSDGSLVAQLPAFSITVSSAPNTPPSISGSPPSSVVAGSAYSFTPTANDVDGDTLAFSISGKPSWATFSTATGTLSGTPTAGQAGSYLNIVIAVSDGKVSTSLPNFAITVSTPVPTGSATLSWTAPGLNTDGSALTNLAGFRIYHGTSAGSLTDVVQVVGSSTSSFTFTQLASGTHYFAMTAYATDGSESAMSTVGSKTIP